MNPRIPAGVAVMFNPLAAGLSWASSVPGTRAGDRVVVLGAGQRGLCRVIAARAAGARQVVITGLGRDAQKLALARELGADAVIDVEREDVVARVREVTGGGAEVVVDTTPYAPRSLNDAIAMAVRKRTTRTRPCDRCRRPSGRSPADTRSHRPACVLLPPPGPAR